VATTINLRNVDPELHRKLRIRAADLGTNVKALVIRYCEEGLKRDKAKKKGK
jgi:plasmid stability protein